MGNSRTIRLWRAPSESWVCHGGLRRRRKGGSWSCGLPAGCGAGRGKLSGSIEFTGTKGGAPPRHPVKRGCRRTPFGPPFDGVVGGPPPRSFIGIIIPVTPVGGVSGPASKRNARFDGWPDARLRRGGGVRQWDAVGGRGLGSRALINCTSYVYW